MGSSQTMVALGNWKQEGHIGIMKKLILALLLAVTMVGFVEAGDKKKKRKKKEKAKAVVPIKENALAALIEEASGKVVWIKLDGLQTRILTKKRQKERKRVKRGRREEDLYDSQRAPIYLSMNQLKAIVNVTESKRKKWPKRVTLYVNLEEMQKRPEKDGLWIKRAAVQFDRKSPSDPAPGK
jgi:hypothetical protein